MSPPDQVQNGIPPNLEITTLVCDERGECQSSPEPVAQTPVSAFTPVSSNYSEDPSLACYSHPVEFTRRPTSVWHSYVAANPREQQAARALGRALNHLIRDRDAGGDAVDPRLRGLASVLQQGYLPTADDIDNNPLFNQSYKDGVMDVIIHAIAARVPQSDQTHRTALALSLPYNLERLDAESRTNVVVALASETQTRSILAEASRNSQTSPSVQTEIARVLSGPGNQPVNTAVAAAQGGAAGAAASNRQEELIRTAALSAVRVVEITHPMTVPLIEGARLALPLVLGDPTGLPFFMESLLWSPSSGTPSPFSNPMPNVLPIAVRDLPGFSVNEDSRAEGSHEGSSVGSQAASSGEAIAHAGSPEGSSAPSAPTPSPVPTTFQRILDTVTHPTPVQSVLIGIASPILSPVLSALATLRGSGLLSQAVANPSAAPALGATLTFAAVRPVSSSSDAQSDSEGSGGSHPGGENSSGGDSSPGDQNPNDENPHRDA